MGKGEWRRMYGGNRIGVVEEKSKQNAWKKRVYTDRRKGLQNYEDRRISGGVLERKEWRLRK